MFTFRTTLIYSRIYFCLIYFWWIYLFTFRCLWFVCFVEFFNFICCNGMSDDLLHLIRFFHVINPFFEHFVCSSDQWFFGRHDLNDCFSPPGLPQNQSNSTGKFQLVYSLFPQQSTTCNKSPANQSFYFKYFFITQTWSN